MDSFPETRYACVLRKAFEMTIHGGLATDPHTLVRLSLRSRPFAAVLISITRLLRAPCVVAKATDAINSLAQHGLPRSQQSAVAPMDQRRRCRHAVAIHRAHQKVIEIKIIIIIIIIIMA